jgi:2-keto-4-pentenoate hydratase
MQARPSPAGLDAGMRRLLASRSAALDGGARAIGWKIGFNGPAVQDHFGLTGAVVGYLTDRTVIPVGHQVDVNRWEHPALEVELAIRVGADGAIAGLAAAVELVDLDLPFDDLEPILAGNVFHRGVIFGPEFADLRLGELEGVVTVDGQVVARGPLTEPPAVTIEFVQAFLAERGAVLAPGDRIIAGSLIAPMSIGSGDHYDIAFGPLGSMRVDVGRP